MGSTSSLINLLVNVFIGLSVGTNVLCANYIGAKQEKAVSETVHTSVLLSLVCGVILVGLGIGKLFSFPLAGMMLGGAGLVLFGLGVLAVWLSVWFCARAVPGVVHLMGRLIHRTGRLFRKGGAGA